MLIQIPIILRHTRRRKEEKQNDSKKLVSKATKAFIRLYDKSMYLARATNEETSYTEKCLDWSIIQLACIYIYIFF